MIQTLNSKNINPAYMYMYSLDQNGYQSCWELQSQWELDNNFFKLSLFDFSIIDTWSNKPRVHKGCQTTPVKILVDSPEDFS